MSKKNKLQRKANTSKTSPAKAVTKKPGTAKNITTINGAAKPTLSDIIKMQAMKQDNEPDKNEPIVLSDTWYEYSVFKSKFNLSPGTAHKWLSNGWLPFSELGKMRFINKADIDNMMLRFRRNTLAWAGWLLALPNDWTEFCF